MLGHVHPVSTVLGVSASGGTARLVSFPLLLVEKENCSSVKFVLLRWVLCKALQTSV